MKTPKISIIIPVYKAEKYLCQCLDSVKSQTYTDWECILVDDGSPDNSGAICDEYATKDNRFRVFHKENGGVSSARNIGIENTSGEYVCFVDSDDVLDMEYLKKLVEGMTDDIYLSMCSWKKIDAYGNDIEYCQSSLPSTMTREQCLKEFFNRTKILWQRYLWNRLLCMSIIREHYIRFNENIHYKEDGLFLIDYLCSENHKVSWIDRPLYHYRITDTSAMGTIQTGMNDRWFTNLESYSLILKSINRIDSFYFQYQTIYSMYSCGRMMKKQIKTQSNGTIYMNRINKILNENIPLHMLSLIIIHKILIKLHILNEL